MNIQDLSQGLQLADFGSTPPEWADVLLRRFNALSAGLISLARGISPADNFAHQPTTITVSHGVASTFQVGGPIGGVMVLGAVGTDGATRMVQTFGCWNASRPDTVNCIFYFHDSEAQNVQVTLLPLQEGLLGAKAPDSGPYTRVGALIVNSVTAAPGIGALILDTTDALTGGNILYYFRNAGVSKAYIDSNGAFFNGNGTFGALNGSNSSFTGVSAVANGASAVGFILDTYNALSTSGAKLTSFRNNGVEKLYVAFGGGLANFDNNFFGGVYINTGGALDANGAVALTIGNSNATSINISKAGIITSIKGQVGVGSDIDFTGGAITDDLQVRNALVSYLALRNANNGNGYMLASSDRTSSYLTMSRSATTENAYIDFITATGGSCKVGLVGTIDLRLTAQATNSGVVIKGNKDAGDAGTDFFFDTYNIRTAGKIVDINNGGSSIVSIDYNGGLTIGARLVQKRVVVTYGASIAINALLGNWFSTTATNGTAFTVANPTNAATGQPITITIRNTSGGALGVVTWDTLYKLAAWTSPATAFSRSITFGYDGTNWVEINRTTVDVPN